MAAHETTVVEKTDADLGKLWPIGAVLAVVGGLLFFLLGPNLAGEHKETLYGSYMFGLLFWTGLTMGCFGLSMLHHATRGSWSLSVLRLFEAGGGWQSLLLMGVLFLPIIVLPDAMHSLYEWTHADVVKNDPILTHKSAYLNEPRWIAFLVMDFVLWIGLAALMRRSTVKQDATKNFKLEAGRSSWGAVGIVIFMFTATFAVLDWIMSMEPHWYSTMYGAWLVVTACYGALALCVVFLTSNANKQPYASVISPQLTKDLGNMLFVLTMLWGYTTLSQFLIIWNGNIAETTAYYARRMAMYPDGMQGNYWAVLGFFLIIGTFFVPFYCLLAPRTKRYVANLKTIAGWMFAMAVLNMYLIVVPALPERAVEGPLSKLTLTDFFAWLLVGGLWLMVFGAISRRAKLIPQYDTRLQEAAANAH
jgi:hypothetical protein